MTSASTTAIGNAASPAPAWLALARAKAGPALKLAAGLIAAACIWEGLVVLFGINPYYLPRLSAIISAILASPEAYIDGFLRTGAETLIGMVAGVLFGIAIGIVFFRVQALRDMIFPIFIVSQTIPVIAFGALIVLWFGNTLLAKAVISFYLTFFPVTVNTLLGLGIVYTAAVIPFTIWTLRGFVAGVPADLEEAAMIDGCTRFQALWRVILPLTLPGMGATLGFVFTAAWSELLFALMLISTETRMTFPVGLLTFVSKFSVDWGQMTAAAVLALIPACAFFAVIQRYLVQGLTAGAVKG